MANAFWAAPSAPPAPPANPWPGVSMSWHGTNGTAWDLCSDESGVRLAPGVTGLTTPPRDRYTSQSAGVPGSRNRGGRTAEREVFWPLAVWEQSGTAAWLEYDAAFWASLNPRSTGVWRVTPPSGQWRELTCRPTGDGNKAWDFAPGLVGWTKYGVYLVAEDPFWYGPEITSPLWTSAAPVDFIDTSGTARVYAWTGTPGKSPSTETVDGVVARTNLCTNPSADYGITLAWGGPGDITADTTRSHSGTASFKYDRTNGQSFRNELTVTEGVTYTYSAWVWAEVGSTFNVRLGGSGMASSNSPTYTGTGDWQRVTHTAIATADGDLAAYPAYNLTTNICWVDDILIEAGATLGDYFDGDTPDERTGGPPYHPGSATTIDSAKLTNPGDEVAWPTWTVTGPVDSVQVSVDGHSVGYGELIEGDVLVIDTDPRVQTATLNGVDVTGDLDSYDFAPIPAGETVPLDIVMVGGGTLQASYRPRYDRAW